MGLARLRDEIGTGARDNPVDLVEAVAELNSWPFERDADDEIHLGVDGHAGAYHLSFAWVDEMEALHLGCAFDLPLGTDRASEVQRLLALVNGQIVMGHFDLWEREGTVVFRQSLLLAGGVEPTTEQVEQLLACALEACECYRPACRFVARGELGAREAMDFVVFETHGEA